MGFMPEQQRPDAQTHVKFNCLALEDYVKVSREVNALPDGREPAFGQNMALKDRMDLVSVSTLHFCTHGFY
jgi:hypothetical protein